MTTNQYENFFLENAVAEISKIICFKNFRKGDFQEPIKAIASLHQEVDDHISEMVGWRALEGEKPKHSFLEIGDILFDWVDKKVEWPVLKGFGISTSKINWVSGLIQIFIKALNQEEDFATKKLSTWHDKPEITAYLEEVEELKLTIYRWENLEHPADRKLRLKKALINWYEENNRKRNQE